KGIESMQVIVGDERVMGIRKSRVGMTPVARDAVAHRAAECLFRPVADTGLRIGRDVRAVDGAERGRDRPAASIGGPTRHSVTDIAVADRGEIGALLDSITVKVRVLRRLYYDEFRSLRPQHIAGS